MDFFDYHEIIIICLPVCIRSPVIIQHHMDFFDYYNIYYYSSLMTDCSLFGCTYICSDYLLAFENFEYTSTTPSLRNYYY